MIDSEILDSLKRLGLNQYESRAYLALLSKSMLTASGVSDHAGIPRPRAYDVLDSLVRQGFATARPGRPVKYTAVRIEEAAENAKKTHAEDHLRKLDEIDRVKKRLADKFRTLKTPEVKEDKTAWLLQGHRAVNSKLESMVKQAKNAVIIATTAAGLQRKLDVLEDTLHEAKRRGVQLKIICPPSALAERAERLGEVSKRNVHHRVVVADDHALLFLTPEEAPHETCLLVKSSFFAQNLKNLL